MKKTYSKPEIVFENFSLNTHIAGDCETITSNPYSGSCGYPLRGDTLFLSSIDDCSTWPQDSTATDGSAIINSDTVCYHVPLNINNVFTSG